MVLQNPEAVLEYYLAKDEFRRACVRKCLNFKENKTELSPGEVQCLEICSTKLSEYIEIFKNQYKSRNVH